MWRNAFTQAVNIALKIHSFNLLCRFVFVGVLLGVGFFSSVQSFVWHVCCWEKEILWLLWGPPKSEELYPAVVPFQPSPASLVTCWYHADTILPGHLGAAAWGARAGFCEEGFTISRSVFTLHCMPGSWEASPCAVWGVCIQRWGWEPKVKSSSTRSPQSPVFKHLRRVELPLSAICDCHPKGIFCWLCQATERRRRSRREGGCEDNVFPPSLQYLLRWNRGIFTVFPRGNVPAVTWPALGSTGAQWMSLWWCLCAVLVSV